MRRLTEFRDRRRHGRASWYSLTAAVCAGAFVSLAQASDPIDNSPSDNPSLVARSSDIAAGKLVQSPEGMVIGTVHDVLGEPASGRPAYIVIATDSGFKAIPSYAIGHLHTRPAPSAAAQPPPPSSGQTVDIGAIFDRLNTSHTGKLTKDEAQAIPTVAANFDAADTNHDGVLTKDEFLAAFKPQQ